jgi:pimeloyl-ACP methyl ester carboxylesterase
MGQNHAPHAVLVHGMGRAPTSMLVLALRLRAAGMSASLFGYSPTFEHFTPCVARLQRHIARKAQDKPCILIGHSLGTVLARAAIPGLARSPLACFFLAPPTTASRIARRVRQWRAYRWLTGEMGQALGDAAFMQSVPVPAVPTVVMAGDAGPTASWLPFAHTPNDGILALEETHLPGARHITLDAMHTFIMYRRDVAREIIATTRSLIETLSLPPPP